MGGAFLIHDLGMGLAAYPDGFDGVRQRPEFRDLVTVLLTAKLERRPSVEELQHPDEAITNEAKFSFIRNLHAARAEELMFTSWTDKASGRSYYLLDDSELRDSLGPTIGRMACSLLFGTEVLVKKSVSCSALIMFSAGWLGRILSCGASLRCW